MLAATDVHFVMMLEASQMPEESKVDLRVECYAGHKADERPIQFWLSDKQYLVEAILGQWYDPENIFYKVRTDDGHVYILRQQTSTPDRRWDLISFRQTKTQE